MEYHSIFLIIDSDGPCVANYNRCREVWRRYMNSHPDIKCMFIRSNPSQSERVVYDENSNTLSFKRGESYIPGILANTIDALEYCINNYKFKFITRTNLSSVWNFSKYMEYIKTINEDCFASGFTGNHYDLKFISGSGFIMNYNTVLNAIEYKKDFDMNDPDDVAFGRFFNNKHIKIIEGERLCYINPLLHPIENDYENIVNNYHYRVVYDGGPQDNFIRNKIVDIIYKI